MQNYKTFLLMVQHVGGKDVISVAYLLSILSLSSNQLFPSVWCVALPFRLSLATSAMQSC